MKPMQEFRIRREQLAQQMGEKSIAIVAANAEITRSADSNFRFRQNSYFYYLTGFQEPDAILVIIGGKQHHRSILFNRANDPKAEQWTGRRLGQEAASETLLVQEAYAIEEFDQKLPELILNFEAVYLNLNADPSLQTRITQAIQKLKHQARQGLCPPSQLCDLEPLLNEMRLFKSESELEYMTRACQISVQAHQRAMKAVRTSRFEYELEAELVHTFLAQGCRSVAYEPIVASGANACILHYTENTAELQPDDLVLIDAAGEYHNYAADITRTYPIHGRFSAQQRALYDLVLLAQQTAMKKIKPGLIWSEIQDTVVHVLTQGLVDLKILHGAVDDLIAQKAYLPFYMHGAGHWLGLDVHDVGAYRQHKQWRALEPNMVFTLEPGLYISPSDDVDEAWWHIGIRIEDNIVVTPTGYKNLTSALVSQADDLEAYLRD